MRMKMVCDDRTLREISNEFLALKKAQKIRDRTLSDYRKYIDKFLAQSENSLDVEILKTEILDFFAEIPKTSPARFNHPYQYLHCMMWWMNSSPTRQHKNSGKGQLQITGSIWVTS